MPVTSWTMLVACLAIAGIPPLSGFWSKDEVLAATQQAGVAYGALFTALWVIGLLTAFLTAFYMFRMWFLTFAGEPKSEMAKSAHESPSVMTIPLIVLAFFAVTSGLFIFEPAFAEMLAAPGTHAHEGLLMTILTSPWTWVGTALAVLGILLAWAMYKSRSIDPGAVVADVPGKQIHGLLENLYYYDAAFMRTGEAVGMGLARISLASDRYIVDGAVRGVGRTTEAVGSRGSRWQTGRVTTYAATVIAGLTVVLLLVVFLLDRIKGVF
jgi:NADH-quinone oxidoreductase subunit L